MPPFRNNSGPQRGRGGARGGARGGRGGPKLPSTLMAEVDAAYGSSSRGRGGPTRKERRKSDREERRAGPSTQGRSRLASSFRNEDEYGDQAQNQRNVPKDKGKKRQQDDLATSKKPEKKKKKLPELTLPGQDTIDPEDGEIEWLEWALKKEKGKGKDILDDGLDDLLDFTDLIGPGGSGLPISAGGEDESDKGDLDNSSLDEDGSEQEFQDDSELDGNSDLDDDDSEMPEDEAGPSEAEDEVSDVYGEGVINSSPSGPSLSESDRAEHHSNPGDETSVKVPASTKYVPPHLRAAELEERARGNKAKVEERLKLERKAQGLLNKLSEANLETILGEIEGLYRGHSRNDVTTALTTLIIQMISNKANLLDSFVVLYATLVGALHRVIGMEFGAHFVHTLIMRYHTLSTDPQAETTLLQATIYETPDASKESLNLLTLVAELYNAQVIGSKLIYDLIRGFLQGGSESEVMGEREVEGLLKILRCSGSQLRSDDPASLKDIVGLVQDKTKGKEKTMTARARFMMETLTNVRNGKVKSSAGSEAGNEAAGRMKKFLSGLGKKRRLLAYEPLRVSLADLLSADKKGKWWLVGAGWSGNPLVELEQQQLSSSTVGEKKTKENQEVDGEEALLDLARKQGMNTDVRRGVFVVLMTSEDYVHACERLNALKLTDVQQREFVRVALHSCGLEKTYNPYYTLILNHLCANSYDHRFTLQYALWDFMRELDEAGQTKVGKQKLANVARATAYVVARGGLELTVFKAVDFTALSKSLSSYLITVIVHFIISLHTVSPLFALPKAFAVEKDFDEETVQERFEKVLSNTELAGGLLYLLEREGRKRLQIILEELGVKERGVAEKGLEVARELLGSAI